MACHTHQTLVMEGIFRHGEFLGKLGTPAIYLAPNEAPPPSSAVQALERYLGKQIHIYSGSIDALVKDGCACWLSLAVDFPSPVIMQKTPFVKLAILHDTMAGEGVFGGPKRALFDMGSRYNDIFAYVSVTALSSFTSERFRGDRNPKAQFIKYGNFHAFDTLPEPAETHPRSSLLSVCSLFKRKNVEQCQALAENLGVPFFHIGGNREYDAEWLAEQNKRPKVCYAGFMPDQFVNSAYGVARYFACLSDDEGFSIPPLEAIMQGVPQIALSPITAHKELYGDYNVNFVRPQDAKKTYSLPFYVRQRDREELFRRFHVGNVSQALISFLASLKI